MRRCSPRRCTVVPLSLVGALSLVSLMLLAAPAAAQPVTTEDGCIVRVGRRVKEARCVACIKKGGVFHKQGARGGFCAMPKRPAAHAVAAPAARGDEIVAAGACRARVKHPGKRRSCLACVRQGGVFHKWMTRAGECRRPHAPPPPAMHRAAGGDEIAAEGGCRARVKHAGKRRSCLACVRRGGVFHKWMTMAGACRLRARPVAAPPPPRHDRPGRGHRR